MDRRIALATAAAVVLTVSAGTAAVSANLGLLSSTDDTAVGQLQPVGNAPPGTETIVIEQVVPGPPAPVGAASTGTAVVTDDGAYIEYEDDEGYDQDDGSVEYEDDDSVEVEVESEATEDQDDASVEYEEYEDDGHDDDD